MMAVNQSQNQIFNQVLEGPVSNQTQRQLATLKALNMQNSLAQSLIESENGAKLGPSTNRSGSAREAALRLVRTATQKAEANPQVQPQNSLNPTSSAQSLIIASQLQAQSDKAAAASTGQVKLRRTLSLNPGKTVAVGMSTGQIFTPSQLSAFKQKTGLASMRLRPSLENEAQSSAEVTGNISNNNALSLESASAQRREKLLEGEAAINFKKSRKSAKNKLNSPNQAIKNEPIPQEIQNLSGDLEAIINKVGKALNLDPSLIKAVIKTESNFKNHAVSPAGAKGLMQLMPGTAKEMGVSDPFNPLENIWGGSRFLKMMIDSYGGNLNKALAAYNWGPGNLKRSGGKYLPNETRRYIEVVNRNYDRFKNDTLSA
jgi:soluble lytic murein transglycosylase-like protein